MIVCLVKNRNNPFINALIIISPAINRSVLDVDVLNVLTTTERISFFNSTSVFKWLFIKSVVLLIICAGMIENKREMDNK